MSNGDQWTGVPSKVLSSETPSRSVSVTAIKPTTVGLESLGNQSTVCKGDKPNPTWTHDLETPDDSYVLLVTNDDSSIDSNGGTHRDDEQAIVELNRKRNTSSSSSKLQWVSPDRFPWLICTLLSVIYLLLFMTASSVSSFLIKESKSYVEGFCVQGIWEGKCSAAAGNSHQYAWGVDVLFTIAAFVLPLTGYCRSPNSLSMMLMATSFALVIGSHGLLHRMFSHQGCPTNGGGSSEYYMMYIGLLMIIDVFGFSRIPSCGWMAAIAATVALTLVTFLLTIQSQSIAAFFMVSELVVSATGLFVPNERRVTRELGYVFILPVAVSLIELVDCDFLVQFGGHAYYDVALHLAFLVSLATADVGDKKKV